MFKKLISGVLLCFILVTPAFSQVGLNISHGTLYLKDGTKVEVTGGKYLSKTESISVAEGIEILKAELEKTTAEMLAYKEAYEKEKNINTRLAEIYESLYLKYELKSEKLQEYIMTLESRVQLVEQQRIKTEGEVKLYKILSTILGTALLIISL